jgi:uncharacterized protein (DUF1015 family)
VIRIRPFIAIRPSAARVREFSMARLDHQSEPDRRQHAERAPKGLAALLEKGEPLVRELLEARALIRHAEPAMFMHRQVRAGRTSVALVACVEGGVFESRAVRPHRHAHDGRSEAWRRHTAHVGAHADPAIVGFDATPEITDLFEREMNDRPLFHVVADDGATHTLWLGTRAEALVQAFSGVREGLLLEGHHRASATTVGGDTLAMLVPMEHVSGRASVAFVGVERAAAFLAASKAVREADPTEAAAAPGHALVCAADAHGTAWFSCRVPERFEEAVHQIESWAGIARWKPGSSMDRDAIEAQVRAGAAGCVVRLTDPELSELQGLSAQGRLLPAASTWFEPRFRSGLCMAELHRSATTISR